MKKNLTPPSYEEGNNFLSGRFYTFPQLLNPFYLLDLLVSGIISALFYLLTKQDFLLILTVILLSVVVVARSVKRKGMNLLEKPKFAYGRANRHFFNIVFTVFLIDLVTISILSITGSFPEISGLFDNSALNFLLLTTLFSGVPGFIFSIPQELKFWDSLTYSSDKNKVNLFSENAYSNTYNKSVKDYKVEKWIDKFFYRGLDTAYNINLGTMILFFLFSATPPIVAYFYLPSNLMMIFMITLLSFLLAFSFLFYRKILFSSREKVIEMLWIGKSVREKERTLLTVKEWRKGFIIFVLIFPILLLFKHLVGAIFIILCNVFVIHVTIQKILVFIKLRES